MQSRSTTRATTIALAFFTIAAGFAAATVHAQEGAGAPEWLPRGDNLYFLNRIAIGVKKANYQLHVVTDSENRAIYAVNKKETGTTYGVYAVNESTDQDAVGVYGLISSTSAGLYSAGVRGENRDTGSAGMGVWGSHDGTGWGVFGVSGGVGVFGVSATGTGVKGSSGDGDGVYGSSTSGTAVRGEASVGTGVYGSSGGTAAGVHGYSINGWAVYSEGELYASQGYKPGGGSWAVASDVRLKKNIEPLEGALDTLLALRGVTFEYIDAQAINELPGERMGFIAQEVEEVIPDWVSERKDGYKAVAVRGFEALAVEAMREMKTKHDAEIASLTAENDELKTRLTQVEAMLAQLAAATSN